MTEDSTPTRVITDDDLARSAIIAVGWHITDETRGEQAAQFARMIEGRCQALGVPVPIILLVEDPHAEIGLQIQNEDQAQALIDHLRDRFGL